MPATPEQLARQTIDAMLAAAGWAVQDYKAFDPSTSLVIALRNIFGETQRLSGYLHFVAEVGRRLGVLEELEAVVTTNLQRATRLRQAILQKAFTGELG